MISRLTAPVTVAAIGLVSIVAAENPFASTVVSYDPGSPTPGLNDPTAALGEPTRMTGMFGIEQPVTAFYPAFSNIVSINPGGHLTLAFDAPIVNNPNHPFGVDLIVFGNSFFIDASHPSGIVGGLAYDGGLIEISEDGETWFMIPDLHADGLYPTIAYADVGPYAQVPGKVPTDFTLPVNPALSMTDFAGASHADIIELYGGSGGGAGVDISVVGLEQVSYVRVTNPASSTFSVEVDAMARVTPILPGDINGDGTVNVTDLLLLLSAWGTCPPGRCAADLNGDGVVNVADLLILLSNWG